MKSECGRGTTGDVLPEPHFLSVCRRIVLIGTLLFWATTILSVRARGADVFSGWPVPAEVSATVGKQSVVIPSGRGGLEHFPDMPISVLGERPLRFLMVCGNDTYLWTGRTLGTSLPVAKVLSPGSAGAPDNNYAGISSVYHDQERGKLIAFYHAEDKEGIALLENGVQGFYGRICAAESPEDKVEFTKLGPVITADQPKKPRGWESDGGPREAWLAQGAGDPYVCVDAEGERLLCMYNELSNRIISNRGVQLCIARAPLDSAGRPGAWRKFYRGSFSEPGLGGHDTPVISVWPHGDTISPHLQCVPQWKRYVVVFGVGIFSEINGKPPRAVESGFYLSTSKDAVTWTKPIKLQTVLDVWVNGKPSAMHPFLVVEKATADSLTGQLMSSYTPSWPDVPRGLVAAPIRLTLAEPSEESAGERDGVGEQAIAERLKGTRWKNSNGVTFEWTADGRFLHNGVERGWKMIDGRRARIVFGPGHEDTLEFDPDLTSFKQLIKGGPSSFDGRRTDVRR